MTAKPKPPREIWVIVDTNGVQKIFEHQGNAIEYGLYEDETLARYVIAKRKRKAGKR